MAGIYVHIPFCKSRCIYCGFYSTVLHNLQDKYVDALLHEMAIRKDYLKDEPVETLYLGGGTPSQLTPANLKRLLSALCKRLATDRDVEITMECNPDDVTEEFAALVASCGVNRVSMGAQTFNNSRLKFLRRRHAADQVATAVTNLRRAGIRNISIDLMFGFPTQTVDEWLYDINKVLELDVEHISAYSLMYEEGTPLYKLLEEGKIEGLGEETCRRMYYTLIDELESAGYEHYEISNFAKPGFRSRHNSSYWRDVAYLGLGAGAHSFDRKSRQWNGDLSPALSQGEGATKLYEVEEIEELDDVTRYNDMITTALRTKEGICIDETGAFADYLMENAARLIERGLIVKDDGWLHLSREGLYVSDDVMSELIFI